MSSFKGKSKKLPKSPSQKPTNEINKVYTNTLNDRKR